MVSKRIHSKKKGRALDILIKKIGITLCSEKTRTQCLSIEGVICCWYCEHLKECVAEWDKGIYNCKRKPVPYTRWCAKVYDAFKREEMKDGQRTEGK